MEFVYSTGGREKYFKGKTGDCVTRAIAIATNKDYKEVYDSLFEFIKSNSRRKTGCSPRNGVRGYLSKRYLVEVLGCEWVPCSEFGKGCTTHLDPKELPTHKTIIVKLSKHLACVKDGKLYDTYDSSRGGSRCVYGYYIVKN